MVQVNVEQKEIIDLLDNVYDDAEKPDGAEGTVTEIAAGDHGAL